MRARCCRWNFIVARIIMAPLGSKAIRINLLQNRLAVQTKIYRAGIIPALDHTRH